MRHGLVQSENSLNTAGASCFKIKTAGFDVNFNKHALACHPGNGAAKAIGRFSRVVRPLGKKDHILRTDAHIELNTSCRW